MLRRRDACREPGFRARSLRSGQLNPNQLGNCRLWLTAEFGVTLGTGVSQWQDQSGAANHVVQASAARQPLFSNADSDFRNMPALEFSPAVPPNGSQRLGTAALDAVSQPVTIAIAFLNQKTTASSFCGYLSHTPGGPSACQIVLKGDAGGTTHQGVWTAGTVNYGPNFYAPNVARTIVGVYENSLSRAWIDRTAEFYNASFGTGRHDMIGIGDNWGVDAATWYFDGKIAEYAVWNRALSDGEIAEIRNTWAAKYGVAQ